MNLFIDDIRKAPSVKWHLVRTISEAVRAVRMFHSDIEEISIDHDISHEVVFGETARPFPCGETFQPVAHFIGMTYSYYKILNRNSGEAYRPWEPKIVIHTASPVGADALEKIFKSYGLACEINMMGPARRER